MPCQARPARSLITSAASVSCNHKKQQIKHGIMTLNYTASSTMVMIRMQYYTVSFINTGQSKPGNFCYTMLPATERNCLAIAGYSCSIIWCHQCIIYIYAYLSFYWKDACLWHIPFYLSLLRNSGDLHYGIATHMQRISDQQISSTSLDSFA